MNDERSEGWVAATCRNHPNLRWTMKDPRIQRISMNPQLMFDGDKDHPERRDRREYRPRVAEIEEVLRARHDG